MNFILQTVDSKIDDIEIFNLIKLLKTGGNKYLHSFILSDTACITEKNSAFSSKEDYLKYIPVGTIQFMQQFFKHYYSIESMKPIEVPECLRTKEFLKRDYKIVTTNGLDKERYSFIKNASILKQFSYTGDVRDVFDFLSEGCLYVQSGVLPIGSEYRALVFRGNIVGLRHYDGDCTLFPDIQLLRKAVDIISNEDNLPIAYTLDIGVGKFGTCIIEMHNFASCGLYGFSDSVLFQMYAHGAYYELGISSEVK